MKKIVLLLAIVCSSVCASAQIYVGGSLGYSQSDDKEYESKRSNVNILPEIGYAFNDKWAIGTTVGFYQNKQELYNEDNNYKHENKNFSISPYVRYSFFRKDIFSLFVDGGPDIRFQKEFYKSNYSENSDKDWKTHLGLGISPGVSVKVCDKLSILAHLGALKYSHSDDEESFDFNLSNSLSLGIFYSF